MTEAPPSPSNHPGNKEGEEETNPLLLSSKSAVSTSPYDHHDTILRSQFLTQKRHDNNPLEHHAHKISSHNTLVLFLWDTLSAMKIFATMLITLESMVGCALTVGATLLAYYSVPGGKDNVEWNGTMPTILLSLAVITPLSQSISQAFTRRENALKALAKYRSALYNLYVAHCSWNWSTCSKSKGRRGCVENMEDELAIYGDKVQPSANSNKDTKHIDWLDHSDRTLFHLIQLSDSLYKYLALPNGTRARHRATRKGRIEGNEILSTGREIFTYTYGHMIMISQLTEALKYRGLPGNEASRIRQWENFMTNAIEDLRVVKEYRTLQALRVFERLFALLLPPFYATVYVQVALDADSLPLGIVLGMITSIALSGLFECVRQLEDPFVAGVTLDGIDVREELVVLAYQELMVARKMLFPEAEEFVLKGDCLAEVTRTPDGHKEGKDETTMDTGDGNMDRRSRHCSEKVS